MLAKNKNNVIVMASYVFSHDSRLDFIPKPVRVACSRKGAKLLFFIVRFKNLNLRLHL